MPPHASRGQRTLARVSAPLAAVASRPVIPLKDYNPTRTRAYVTIFIIGVCVVVYFFIQPGGQRLFQRNVEGSTAALEDIKFTFAHAAIPCEVTTGDPVSVDELRTGTCLKHDQSPRPFPDKSIYLAILYSMFLHGSILHIAGN